jgi:hypothetical protein
VFPPFHVKEHVQMANTAAFSCSLTENFEEVINGNITIDEKERMPTGMRRSNNLIAFIVLMRIRIYQYSSKNSRNPSDQNYISGEVLITTLIYVHCWDMIHPCP